MNKIVFPIITKMKGSNVASLHRALAAFGFEVPEKERANKRYGAATKKAISAFQKEHSLKPTGTVNAATAKILNAKLQDLAALEGTSPEALPEFQQLVRGQVRYEDGLPIAGLKMKVFDQHLRKEVLLGEATTDADGRFEVYYSVEALRRKGQQTVSLLVRVLGKKDGETKESVLAESSVIFEAGIVEKVNLRVPGGIRHAWSEYEQMMEEIKPVLEGTPISSLAEDEKRQDLSYLSGRIGRDVKVLAQLAGAHKLAERTKLPPEVLFGLARKKIPLKLSELLAQSPRRRRDALISAIYEHLIPGRFVDELDKLEGSFQDLAVRHALEGGGGKAGGPLRDLLRTTRLTTKEQARFAEKFVKHKGPIPDFWKALRQEPDFAQHVDELQFAFQLGALTANHAPLMRRIQHMQQSGDIQGVRDLARFDAGEWKQFVGQPDETGKVTFPTEISGADDDEKATRYAAVLTKMMEDAFPVESLAHRIQSDMKGAHAGTRTFFQNVLDIGIAFDLGHATIDAFLKENPELLKGVKNVSKLTADLKAIQRLYKLTPKYEQIAPLINAGLTSAFAIHRMGQKAFAAQFSKEMGGTLIAMQLHAQAGYATAAALNIMANLAPWFTFPMNVLPWSPPNVSGVPDWETLFGSFDLCTCDQCRSVHSPAAYLAELLAFLKERKIDIALPEGGTAKTNLREILYRRRPDLGNIELTCDNTNTCLPYIDLTNEILENAIQPFQPFGLPLDAGANLDARLVTEPIRMAFANAGHELASDSIIVIVQSGEKWFITDHRRLYSIQKQIGQISAVALGYQTFGTEADLAANPSHVNTSAYAEIATAVHPWSLPLDLWTLETRVWLDKAGVERAELMRAFQPQHAPFDPGDQAIACETAGLTKAEMQIISGTDPHPLWEFWGLTQSNNPVEIPDPADPSNTITAALDWVQALTHVRFFLRQSGLTYDELLSLRASRFVNSAGTLRIESLDPNDLATCDTHKLIITDLTAPVLDRLHRFVRLWRKLGWTVRELDLAVAVFQGAIIDPNAQLVPRLIEQLAVEKQLAQMLGAPLEQLLALWGAIDTRRGLPGDPNGEDSLYDKLFLNPEVLKPMDSAFVLNAGRTEIAQAGALIADHFPAVLGGLGITASELTELVASELADGNLNLANLTALYRGVVLANGLGLTVGEFIRWKSLSGMNPFDSAHPEDTFRLIQSVQKITAAGFSLAEADYLLRHQIGTDTSLAPVPETIALVLTEIRAGLQKIQDELVLEADLSGELTRKYLGLLKWDPAHIELVVSMLNANPSFSATLEEFPTAAVFPPSVAGRAAWDGERHRLTFAGILTAADRAALMGLAVPPELLADYLGAIEQLYRQSNAFLDAVRAYERPIFRTAMALASMPASNHIPQRLRSRFFYDRKATELCFSGLMLAQDFEELSSIAGVDAVYQNALDQLQTQSSDFIPASENEFLNESLATQLLAADVTPPQRFSSVLERLLPRLRRLLGESLVKQKLSEALGTDPAALGYLLDAATIDGILAPEFSESHISLEIDASRFPALFEAYGRLSKGVLVREKLGISSRQLAWYFRFLPSVPARKIAWQLAVPGQSGWLDFRNLPLVPNPNPTPELFAAFLRLLELCKLRDQLLPAGEIALEEILTAANDPVLSSNAPALTDAVAAILKRRTGWDENGTKTLSGDEGIALALPEDFRDETGPACLVRCQKMAQRINALPDQARAWAREGSSAITAQGIKQALRARCGEEMWKQLAKPAQDVLREAKRAALVAYLEVRPPNIELPDGTTGPAWKDASGLFGYFLIDVEMTSCWETSRIKQAISSVQLFVQRCLLNLETGVRIDATEDDMWCQWKWMKNYRVWEANRKIFLYPENWIEPELRDDKTPFFQELENEILQNDLTATTAEDAFLHYLEKMDAVARLELVGMYQQDAADGQQPILHVFGRTQGKPAVYYYRRRVGTGHWTPWEKVDLDIEGDHLIPVAWNRRLYLFWPLFSIKAHSTPPEKDNPLPPSKYFEIQLGWSEYKNGRWLPKRVTSQRIQSQVPYKEDVPEKDGRDDHVFFTSIGSDGLRIWPEWDNPQTQFTDLVVDEYQNVLVIPQTVASASVETFLFTSVRSDAVIESGRTIYGVFNPSRTHVRAMRFEEDLLIYTMILWEGQPPPTDPLYLPLDETTSREEIALNQTPGAGFFQLLYPHQDFFLSGRKPFFFEDQARAFFITPERMPIAGFNWHQAEKIDPGQNYLVQAHYYMLAKKGQSNLPKAAPTGGLRREAGNLTRTNEMAIVPLTQQGLQLRIRQENISAASGWLAVDGLLSPGMLVPVFRRSKRYRFQAFYHPYLGDFIKALNKGGVDDLLTLDIQKSSKTYFADTYQPKGLVVPDYPVENVDFTPAGAYSQYNWELFFHAPLLIATRLGQNQRFEEAQQWFHYIFDPTDASSDDAPRKFWRTKPFHDLQREDYLQQRIEQLIKPTSSGGPNPQLAMEIEEWRSNPSSPHAVARLRLTAYQKSVVMKYLDNLIAWADQLFRQDTIESINEATQLYVLAAEILGAHPTEMAPRAQPQVQTYNSLDPLLSEFSNKLVDIEYLVPSPSPDAVIVKPDAPSLPIPQIPYFCVPRNEKLMGYWTTVADRLFKIRHCMNIEGVVRQLALFEPPIDPGLLVRAAAAGVDLGSVLNDMNAPLPSYRFQVMAQKATELCSEVKALGAALLSAIEKRDAEALALLRSTHEIALLKQVRSVREQQLQESAENVAGLENGKLVTEARRDFYRDIVRINQNEQLNLDKLQSAHEWQMKAQQAELFSALIPLIGDFDLGTSGWAATPVVKWKWGGINLGMVAQATARVLNYLASVDQFEATNASTKGVFDRHWEEWKHQENLATLELKQVERNIAAAKIRQAIAEQELANHDLQMENTRAVDEMMRTKFSNRELFDWMVGQVSALFFQGYQLAYDVSRRAERAYRHELGVKDSNFIQFGYWDSLKKGLLAGERLFHDLKRMEVSYLDQHKREYEITKHVSLTMLNPQALVALKESGSCFFNLPEAVFDLDHPGQYLRRIKSVSLSLPCVTGPYTSVSAKLTLLGNRIRREVQTKADGSDYAWRGIEDPRFAYDVGGIQSIVTSTAREDGGVFELNFHDERYLPFEGAGAVSSWRIELPAALRQFDYDTISDVILHVRYTARDGGEPLKDSVTNRLIEALRLMQVEEGKTGLFCLFSLRREFPDRWYQFLQSAPVNGEPPTLTLELPAMLFPTYTQDRTIKIKRLLLLVQPRKPKVYDPLSDPLGFSVVRPGNNTPIPLEAQALPGDLSASPPAALDLGAGVVVKEMEDQAIWKFAPTQIPAVLGKTVDTPDGAVTVLDPDAIKDIVVLYRYTIE
jgi:hypothetical protein